MSSLNQTQVLGEAKRLLDAAGFSDIGAINVTPILELQIFEDDRSIVGLIYHNTWSELEANWLTAQSAMVERMSERIRRSDPKSWDGYLVLFTTDDPTSTERLSKIKNNTNRLRKLVATRSELTALAAVKGTLLPVLPFDVANVDVSSARLTDRIPDMLEAQGIDRSLATAALQSFQQNQSPMAGIWSWRQAR